MNAPIFHLDGVCQGWRCTQVAVWARWLGRYCTDHAIRAGWIPGPVLMPGTQMELRP